MNTNGTGGEQGFARFFPQIPWEHLHGKSVFSYTGGIAVTKRMTRRASCGTI